jgi:mannosyltransferase
LRHCDWDGTSLATLNDEPRGSRLLWKISLRLGRDAFGPVLDCKRRARSAFVCYIMSKPNQRNWLLIFLLILLLGTALRLYQLDGQSLWTDEITSYRNSSGTLSQVVFEPQVNSNVPPLYYLVVHWTLLISGQDWALRFPSLVFGVLSILLLFSILRRWSGSSVALVGSFLLAISPFHVWYSQEMRPYALLIMLSLLTFWFYQRLGDSPGNRLLQAGFLLSAAFTFYCHTVALAFIGFLGVHALFFSRYRNRGYWFAVFAGIGVLLVPAVLLLWMTPPIGSANPSNSVDITGIAYAFWTFAAGFSLGPSVRELQGQDRLGAVYAHLRFVIPVALVFGALLVIGLVQVFRRNREVFWVASGWLLAPLALAVLGALVTVHPFNVRYAILSFPAFAILLTYGVAALGSPRGKLVGLLALSFVSAISLQNYYWNEEYHRDNNRAAGHYLAQHAQPGDLVVASAPYTVASLQYYAGRDDVRFVGYPQRPPRTALLRDEGEAARWVNPQLVSKHMPDLIGERQEFWLFLSRTYHSDPSGHLPAYFDEHFERLNESSWKGTRLILYSRRSRAVPPPGPEEQPEDHSIAKLAHGTD